IVPENAPLGLPGKLVGDIDLTLWLATLPPNLVHAVESPADAAVPGRFIQVHLGFPGDGMALVDYSDPLPAGDESAELSVIGPSGAAYADDHQNMQLVYRGGHPEAVRTGEGVRHLVTLTQEFVDALSAGRDVSASLEGWQNVLPVVAAVRRSLAS